MSMRGSPLPLLPIGALIEAGFFHETGSRSFSIPSIHGEGIYFCQSKVLHLLVNSNLRLIEVNIDIVPKRMNLGNRLYFSCPICRRSVIDLVIVDNIFCCLSDYRNLDIGFSQMHRRSLVLEARDALRSTRTAANSGPAYRSTRYAERTRYAEARRLAAPRPRRDKSVMTRADLTTEYALNLGRGANQYDIYFHYWNFEPEYWRRQASSKEYVFPASPAPIFDTPVLDIGVLMGQFAGFDNLKDNVYAKTLGWEYSVLGEYRPIFFVDGRDDEIFLMVADYFWLHEDLGWQYIELRKGSNGRVHFTCPVTGISCARLYWRDGFFASWQAQKLYHPSQRGKGRKRKRSA